MGFFRRTLQRITISSEMQGALEALAAELRARKLKDTQVSSVGQGEDQWQFAVACKDAEQVYYQEVLPLLYNSAETQSCKVLLEFNDESELVKRCPKELLISFRLNSRYAFGDKAEHEFIQKMHRDILKSPQDSPAAVTYYIVGGGAVTMCVPCADPEEMGQVIEDKLSAFKIAKFMINTIDREGA